MAAAVERALGHFERFLGGFGEGLGLALGAPLLGDLVQLGLGALDLSEGGNVLTRVERAFDQVAAYADQGTEQRQIVDLLGEVPCADHGRARSRQLREICGAANLFYRLRRLRTSGRKVTGLATRFASVIRRIGFVDAPVQRLEEMIRPKLELDVLDQPVVDHQRAEQRGLGFDVLRECLGSGLLTRTRRYE